MPAYLKLQTAVHRLKTSRLCVFQRVTSSGCSPVLLPLFHSLLFSPSNPSLHSLFLSLSPCFCTSTFISTLNSVLQQVLTLSNWDLNGKIAVEMFTTLAILFANCQVLNRYANLTISVRILTTIEYFVRCFGPLELRLRTIFNENSVKVALEGCKSMETVAILKDLADIRAYWGDMEGLFYVNFALGQGFYSEKESEEGCYWAGVYLQRALNCAKRCYGFGNGEKGVEKRVLCELLLSDLGVREVETEPVHRGEDRERQLVREAGVEWEVVTREQVQRYEVLRTEEIQADERTLEAYFRCASGSTPVLHLYAYSFLDD